MARKMMVLCDFETGTCTSPATSYALWKVGEAEAFFMDLCDEHAKPLLAMFEPASKGPLPSKPRRRRQVTELVATPRTAHLKRPKS